MQKLMPKHLQNTLAITLLAALTTATPVSAQETSWDYVQVSHVTANPENDALKWQGLAATFSTELSDKWFIGAEYSQVDRNQNPDDQLQTLEFHGGQYQALTDTSNAYWQVGLTQQHHLYPAWGGEESSKAWFVNARGGMVFMTFDALEFNGYVEYQHATDSDYRSDWLVGVQARYYVSPAFSVQASYNTDSFTLGAAYHF